jgi:hypothetical protein
MDSDDIQIIVFLGVATFWVTSWLLRRRRAHDSKNWPTTEATVETGKKEVVARFKGVPVELPVFGFSYSVSGERLSGRFALKPYITDPGHSIVTRMIGRKLQLRYNPAKPAMWFIPDELIEGCRVEQKLDPHFVSFPPSDS